jgi:hypothetical protein
MKTGTTIVLFIFYAVSSLPKLLQEIYRNLLTKK